MSFHFLQANKIIDKTILRHCLCWLMLIVFELLAIYYSIGKLEDWYIYLCYYAINISFFYLVVRILNLALDGPSAEYFKGVLLFILLFCGYFIAKGTIDWLLGNPSPVNHNPFVFIQDFVMRNVFRAIYFLVLATFYWSASHVSYFRKKSMDAENRQLLLKKEKAELETLLERSRNAYLQQQINPHMLFNALNFIYNKVQVHSADAAQCVWLLSEIMRFGLDGAEPDGKVALSRELEQIDHLLAINRYRFREPLQFKAEVEGPADGLRIIPLILLTLTENIFKHGDLTNEDHPALLQVKTDSSGRLTFFSRNLKKSKNAHRRKQALGLQNVRIRLDSAYPLQYQLHISEPGDLYELTLSLNL